MATAIGTDVVTSIARRYILPEITDNIYNSNVLFFRLNRANKKIVRGGYQIEVPLMYQKMASGGFYQGFDLLDTTPSDTVKNGAWDWKQAYVPVTVDGLTLIKTDSPEAIADFIRLYFAQAEMELADILGDAVFSDGTTDTDKIDGLDIAVLDSGTYAGIDRSANSWWNAQADSNNNADIDMASLQALFGNCSEGGRHPTIIVTGQKVYNDYYSLFAGSPTQRFPTEPMGHDEQLAQAGFSNLLFNGVPMVVDSHVPLSTEGTDEKIYMLNEDYMYFACSPRADFYVEDFQSAINQDAMVAKLLWAGNLIFTNCARQGYLDRAS